MILYFTATGNSLYVAKRIGGQLLSIPQMVKEERYDFEDETIGIVFPVFHVNIPDYIRDFLTKATFKCQYMFAIAASTADEVKKIMDARSIPISYLNTIQMLDNFIPAFDMNEQKISSENKNIEGQIEQIKADIDKKREFILEDSEQAKAITADPQYGNDKLYLDLAIAPGDSLDLSFYTDDKCIRCGTCAKVCPLGNITVEDKPKYHHHCIACVSCIQNCPVSAIHMNTEKSEARFRNSNITVGEIINSNNQQ